MSARILVVDDEPDLEELIQQKFRHQIRDGAGVGVGAPQFGPRRALFAGLTQRF